MPYWVVNATSLPLTLQHYFHPSMLSGGGGGIYDSGNPMFWGEGGGGSGGDGSSEERAQHLRLNPVVDSARGYAAAAAATTAPAAAATAAGLPSTVSSKHTDAMPEVSTTVPRSGRRCSAAAVVGSLPPAKQLPGLGLGLKLLVHEEERGSGGEEKQHSRVREEQAVEESELPRLAQEEEEGEGPLL